MPDRPLRVGIWAAVSSAPQAAPEMASLPDQEQLGREFAQAIGGQVVSVYAVPGHSREYIFLAEIAQDVPAYRQLQEDLHAKRLDVLWVYDENRLGRTLALIAQVVAIVERDGAELYVHTSPHPLGQRTSSHLILTGVKGAFAEQELGHLRYRHRMGMKGRIFKRGLHAGHWPLGYRAIRDDAGKVTGAEQDSGRDAVHMITALFLSGLSFKEIQRRMNASPYRPRFSSTWQDSTIRRITNNDCYAGLLHWRGETAQEPSGTFPPLWDAATFAAVVRERQRRAAGPYTRTGGGPYSGVCFCTCGAPMYRTCTHHKGKVYHYLKCGQHFRDRSQCHENCIAEHRVTAALTRALAERCNTAVLDAALEKLGAGDAERTLHDDRERAQAHAAELEEQRLRLAHALAAGKLQVDMYYTVDADLAERLSAERQRITDLTHAIEAMPDVDGRRAAIAAIARDFSRIIRIPEPAKVAAILQGAGIQVYCQDGQVVDIRLGC